MFGAKFFPEEEKLASVIVADSSARSPILLCSEAGYGMSIYCAYFSICVAILTSYL